VARAAIIDGKALAAQHRERIADRAHALARAGRPVSLDAILVDAGDTAARQYAHSQARTCQKLSIDYRLHTLPESATEFEIRIAIDKLNNDDDVTGIMLNLPLPDNVDTPAIQYEIDPYKDVEGVNPANIGLLFYDAPIIAPCTALAVMEILKQAECAPRGLNAVVVGQGAIAGRPIALFLQHEMATVTTCHSATRDLAEFERVYKGMMTMGTEHPQIIGFGWCGFYETPHPGGRSGLVDCRTGEPLADRLKVMKKWNAWMENHHGAYSGR